LKLEGLKSKRLKKFYYLSLLCLFPGFGIFIGIILLFYAVFVFRNIKLILVILLIMTGGITLMKLDACQLERELMFGKDTEGLLELHARNDLNVIVRNLELYKVKTSTTLIVSRK
jgi:hypothetical protein